MNKILTALAIVIGLHNQITVSAHNTPATHPAISSLMWAKMVHNRHQSQQALLSQSLQGQDQAAQPVATAATKTAIAATKKVAAAGPSARQIDEDYQAQRAARFAGPAGFFCHRVYNEYKAFLAQCSMQDYYAVQKASLASQFCLEVYKKYEALSFCSSYRHGNDDSAPAAVQKHVASSAHSLYIPANYDVTQDARYQQIYDSLTSPVSLDSVKAAQQDPNTAWNKWILQEYNEWENRGRRVIAERMYRIEYHLEAKAQRAAELTSKDLR